MKPLIQAILASLVGEKDAKEIEIISNETVFGEDGSWRIKYRHPSRCVSSWNAACLIC